MQRESETHAGKCRAVAVKGSEKCRVHGGKTPKGIASKSLKTGRYSEYLPAPVAMRADEFKTDPELVELREMIAVQDVRVTELYQQLDRHESAEARRDLKVKYKRWKDGWNSDPFEEENSPEIQKEFERLLFDGSDREIKNDIVWRKIEQSTEYRRRLAESQAKYVRDNMNFVSKEQFQVFTTVITDISKRNVTDADILNRISEEFLPIRMSK